MADFHLSVKNCLKIVKQCPSKLNFFFKDFTVHLLLSTIQILSPKDSESLRNLCVQGTRPKHTVLDARDHGPSEHNPEMLPSSLGQSLFKMICCKLENCSVIIWIEILIFSLAPIVLCTK